MVRAMAHEPERDDAHEHGTLSYLGARIDDATLAQLREVHPDLAENLEATRRFADLAAEDREKAALSQRKVEGFHAWTPGYHAEGDRCGACGEPTAPLFFDRFERGELPYAAFVANVPVHPTRGCVAAFAKAHPRLSAQQVDRLRREFTREAARPTAALTQFFRHDLLSHPPFALEDWANSVADANGGRLDKGTVRDIERLLHWVHPRLFH